MLPEEFSAERDTPASRAAARERNEEFRKRQAEVGMAFDYGRLLASTLIHIDIRSFRYPGENNG